MTDWSSVVVWALENPDPIMATLFIIGFVMICIAASIFFWALTR